MVVILRRARSMGWTWLCCHLLLCILVTLLASTAGELCLSWNSIHKIHYQIFLCDVDVKFCCGNCSEPYCCSSAEDRLDINQCFRDPDPQPGQSTDAPQIESDSSSIISYVPAFIMSAIAIVLTTVALSYGFHYWRQSWRKSREEDIPMPLQRFPWDWDDIPSNQKFSSSDSHEDVHDPITSQPTSNVQPVAQSGDRNASFQGNGAQRSPGSHLDSALGTRGSTRGSNSSSILWHSDAEESHGTNAHPAPSTGDNLPSNDAPLYSVEDPNDSLGLDASWPPVTLEDSSEAESAAQGNQS